MWTDWDVPFENACEGIHNVVVFDPVLAALTPGGIHGDITDFEAVRRRERL